MRIILSLENVNGTFVLNGLVSGNAGGTVTNSIAEVKLYNPTFFMNMVIVDPTVDAQLIKVSSLKAIYFTFSPTSWLGTESFDQTDYQ